MIFARALLALVFALGALLMVAVAAVLWLGLVANAAEHLHILAGAALFVASFFLMARYRDMVAAPWQMWMGLWSLMDDWMANLQHGK